MLQLFCFSTSSFYYSKLQQSVHLKERRYDDCAGVYNLLGNKTPCASWSTTSSERLFRYILMNDTSISIEKHWFSQILFPNEGLTSTDICIEKVIRTTVKIAMKNKSYHMELLLCDSPDLYMESNHVPVCMLRGKRLCFLWQKKGLSTSLTSSKHAFFCSESTVVLLVILLHKRGVFNQFTTIPILS